MVEIRIEASALESFRRGWDEKARKALLSAMKGEANRLRAVVKDRLASGVGPPTAPLTVAEQRTKTSKALSALAPFVAYEVEDRGGEVVARIGLGRSVGRDKNPARRRRALVKLFGGWSKTITREDQIYIAGKIRRRQARMFAAAVGRRSMSQKRAFRGKWPDIRHMIPKRGAVMEWPGRDLVAQVVQSERDASRRNIEMLYQKALSGERWANQWWVPGQLAGLRDAGAAASPQAVARMEQWLDSLLGGTL